MSDKKSLADSIVKKKQDSKLRKYAQGGEVDSDNSDPTATDQAQASMRKAFHYPKAFAEGGEVEPSEMSEDDIRLEYEQSKSEDEKQERLARALKSRRRKNEAQ